MLREAVPGMAELKILELHSPPTPVSYTRYSGPVVRPNLVKKSILVPDLIALPFLSITHLFSRLGAEN